MLFLVYVQKVTFSYTGSVKKSQQRNIIFLNSGLYKHLITYNTLNKTCTAR